MPTAIIIGASSGIGREIALQLAGQGFRLGVAARRTELLEALVRSLGSDRCVAKQLDLSRPETCIEPLDALARELGPIDVVYLVAGTGFPNPELEWAPELATLQVNCTGFAAVAVAALKIFETQKFGHLVGITSVLAIRPSASAPAYGASKTFASYYLTALRYRVQKSGLPIFVTEIRPGPVDTAMLKGVRPPFWILSAAIAAKKTIAAVNRRKRIAYVPRRWGVIAAVVKWIPDYFYARRS
jgi:short-subunit dehydrogenase